jgi:hypothetical protein
MHGSDGVFLVSGTQAEMAHLECVGAMTGLFPRKTGKFEVSVAFCQGF